VFLVWRGRKNDAEGQKTQLTRLSLRVRKSLRSAMSREKIGPRDANLNTEKEEGNWKKHKGRPLAAGVGMHWGKGAHSRRLENSPKGWVNIERSLLCGD